MFWLSCACTDTVVTKNSAIAPIKILVFIFKFWFYVAWIDYPGEGLISLLIFFWNRVIPAGSPRMAPRNALHAQPRTLERTPFLYGLNRILGT